MPVECHSPKKTTSEIATAMTKSEKLPDCVSDHNNESKIAENVVNPDCTDIDAINFFHNTNDNNIKFEAKPSLTQSASYSSSSSTSRSGSPSNIPLSTDNKNVIANNEYDNFDESKENTNNDIASTENKSVAKVFTDSWADIDWNSNTTNTNNQIHLDSHPSPTQAFSSATMASTVQARSTPERKEKIGLTIETEDLSDNTEKTSPNLLISESIFDDGLISPPAETLVYHYDYLKKNTPTMNNISNVNNSDNFTRNFDRIVNAKDEWQLPSNEPDILSRDSLVTKSSTQSVPSFTDDYTVELDNGDSQHSRATRTPNEDDTKATTGSLEGNDNLRESNQVHPDDGDKDNTTTIVMSNHNGETDNMNEDGDRGNTNPNIAATESSHPSVSYGEIRYSIESFYAIMQPVFLTMLLTAIAVIYISTPESRQFYEQGLSQAYTVFDTGNIDGTNTDSNSVKFAKSLVNALVIVSVICGMTFVVVLLYKYNCVKCLWAYMILANIVLLGFLSGTMFQVAIDRYQLYVDKISFYWFLYNLAFVGVLAIFASTKGGVPSYITQAYLILCSVIVAWQLSNFDNWTAWSLLVFLALYDLFAVLSPCGPLKALVKLMMKEDAPEMPGLLYEANINRPPPTDSSNPMNISNNGNENIVINDTTVGTSTAINTSTTGDATGEGFGSTTTAQQTRSSDLRSTHVKSTEPTQTQSRTDLFQHNNDNHNDATSDDGSGLLLLLSTSSDSTAFSGPSLTDVSSMSSTSNHREYDRTLPIKTAIEENITGRSTKRRVEVVIENPYLAPRNYDEDEDEADGNDADVESGNDNESPMTSPFGSETDARQQSHRLSVETSADETTQRRTASVPYALAKLYRLPTVHEPQPPWIISQRQSDSRKVLRPAQIIREEVKDEGSVVSTSYIDPNYDTTTSASAANISVSTNNNNDIDDTSVATVIFTAEQLTAMIDVVFPRNGGHIRKAEQQIAGQEVRWEIVDGNSNVKRILFVKSDTGKVYEDFGHMNNNNEPQRQRRQSNISERNSIRLGLGDFIFYSVLVSKAALYSFPTLVTAIVAIITGLGLTLLLLGISGKALPALPISIALGVSFFFQTKFVTEPWLNQILFVNQNGTMYV